MRTDDANYYADNIFLKHVCINVALQVEIHTVMLFNSRNTNILHAAVASTFLLQANSSRMEEAVRPTDSLRKHPFLLALRPRETDIFAGYPTDI